MRKYIFILVSLVFFSGCANTTFHTLASPDFEIQNNDVIGVLPLNIIISLLDSYPGQPIIDEEKSREVALGIDEQLRQQLKTFPFKIVFFQPRYISKIADKDLRQAISSHNEVELSIMSSFFEDNSKTLKSYQLDKSIHNKLLEFRDTVGATHETEKIRYLIAITLAESFSSPKRFRQLLGTLITIRPYLGERIDAGIENGGLSIIDLHTGQIVWNITRGRMRDPFHSSSQAAFVASMLKGLPVNSKPNQ